MAPTTLPFIGFVSLALTVFLSVLRLKLMAGLEIGIAPILLLFLHVSGSRAYSPGEKI